MHDAQIGKGSDLQQMFICEEAEKLMFLVVVWH